MSRLFATKIIRLGSCEWLVYLISSQRLWSHSVVVNCYLYRSLFWRVTCNRPHKRKGKNLFILRKADAQAISQPRYTSCDKICCFEWGKEKQCPTQTVELRTVFWEVNLDYCSLPQTWFQNRRGKHSRERDELNQYTNQLSWSVQPDQSDNQTTEEPLASTTMVTPSLPVRLASQRHFPRMHLASYYRDSPEIPDGITRRLPEEHYHMINRDQSPPCPCRGCYRYQPYRRAVR